MNQIIKKMVSDVNDIYSSTSTVLKENINFI